MPKTAVKNYKTNVNNMSGSGENKIILTLLNGTGHVFDLDDYMELRTKHHIVGSLVGTCSTRGWSANESMLPAELSRCETQLLVDQGIATLVSKKHSLLSPASEVELTAYNEEFNQRIVEQADTLKAEKLRETECNMEKVLAGKRKKLLATGIPAEEIHVDAASVLKEIADNLVFDRKNALLQIHCAHPIPHTANIVRLPADKSLKYRVFRDFWLQGKFVTCGEAFGGDFLVYPGDPLLYHASHIVILLHQPRIQPLKLIAKVRLSVTVNKICVFAYFGSSRRKTERLDAEHEGKEERREEEKEGLNRSDVEESEEEAENPPICYQTVLWEGNHRCAEQ